MLVRTDPFRGLDRVAAQMSEATARSSVMPMDAWRDGERFVLEFDLPDVNPDAVELDIERNVLTVRAERLSPTGPDVELIASERPRGVFSRQVILGDSLDTDRITATYRAGVLRLTVPVAERAKPRRITVRSEDEPIHSAVHGSEPAGD